MLYFILSSTAFTLNSPFGGYSTSRLVSHQQQRWSDSFLSLQQVSLTHACQRKKHGCAEWMKVVLVEMSHNELRFSVYYWEVKLYICYCVRWQTFMTDTVQDTSFMCDNIRNKLEIRSLFVRNYENISLGSVKSLGQIGRYRLYIQ